LKERQNIKRYLPAKSRVFVEERDHRPILTNQRKKKTNQVDAHEENENSYARQRKHIPGARDQKETVPTGLKSDSNSRKRVKKARNSAQIPYPSYKKESQKGGKQEEKKAGRLLA